jgi:arsenate reductase
MGRSGQAEVNCLRSRFAQAARHERLFFCLPGFWFICIFPTVVANLLEERTRDREHGKTVMSEHNKAVILILCTGNSCRSHLAEGILQKAMGVRAVVAIAGSRPAGYVHPLAIKVMAEIGIDISGHASKGLNDFLHQNVETVITVCGNANQACPVFPGQVNRHHWPFEDPAHAEGTEEQKLAVFRRVRDEIRRVFEAYAAGRSDEGSRYGHLP